MYVCIKEYVVIIRVFMKTDSDCKGYKNQETFIHYSKEFFVLKRDMKQ